MHKIFNVMLSRDLGGIQQSFLDYNNIIAKAGFEPISITSTNAKILPQILCKNYVLPNYCSFDLFSKYKLRKIIIEENPKLVIAHGKRAITFTHSASKFLPQKTIIIGVAHNYWIKPLFLCDYVFSITTNLRNYLIDNGYDREKIFIMPNTINISSLPNDKLREKFSAKKVIIGTLARFVHKKGIDVLIKAASILNSKKIEFEIRIGGDNGEELEKIKKLIRNLNLQDKVQFLGWITNKEKFFNDIDIFCLPSRQEPFGIIILEAMLNRTPIISTKSEGPIEILSSNEAVLVDIDSAEQIANGIIFLKNNVSTAVKLSNKAFLRVTENYSIKNSAINLKTHIKTILSNDL